MGQVKKEKLALYRSFVSSSSSSFSPPALPCSLSFPPSLVVTSASRSGISSKACGILPLGLPVSSNCPLVGAKEQQQSWGGSEEQGCVPPHSVGETILEVPIEGLLLKGCQVVNCNVLGLGTKVTPLVDIANSALSSNHDESVKAAREVEDVERKMLKRKRESRDLSRNKNKIQIEFEFKLKIKIME